MTDVNFEDILNTQADTIEKPKPLPEGSYNVTVKGFDFTTMGKKDTPVVKVAFEIDSAGDDVSVEALELIGDVTGKKTTSNFFLTEDALFRLTDFCVDHVGIDKEGKTLGQIVEETKNMPVGITIKHQASKDGETVYAQVSGTHAID